MAYSVSMARDSSEKNHGSEDAVPGSDIPGTLQYFAQTRIRAHDQGLKCRMELGYRQDSSEGTERSGINRLFGDHKKSRLRQSIRAPAAILRVFGTVRAYLPADLSRSSAEVSKNSDPSSRFPIPRQHLDRSRINLSFYASRYSCRLLWRLFYLLLR